MKKREDRRIRRGHPWVFSNEIEKPAEGTIPGELVEVVDHDGRPMGTGYVNPHSLIAVRMIAKRGEEVGPGLIRDRLVKADGLRRRFYPDRDTYRAVYSESDYLPGLVVDRYGSWLSVQSLTAGIERLLPDVIDALKDFFNPAGIVLRNDAPLRALEGLPLEKRVAHGEYEGPVTVDIDGSRFRVDLMEGQKTGFFLDQVDNYRLLKGICEGEEVLDLFSHTGAWGISAAKAGASNVVCVDSSGPALEVAAENARLNGISDDMVFVRQDAFEYLKSVHTSGKRCGVAVVDPPAFIKSRAKVAEGLKGYIDLNIKAMKAVKAGGYLITCSCSHHLERETFREMLKTAASSSGRSVRLLEMRSQSKDHPVMLAAPETEYLKCALLHIL